MLLLLNACLFYVLNPAESAAEQNNLLLREVMIEYIISH